MSLIKLRYKLFDTFLFIHEMKLILNKILIIMIFKHLDFSLLENVVLLGILYKDKEILNNFYNSFQFFLKYAQHLIH